MKWKRCDFSLSGSCIHRCLAERSSSLELHESHGDRLLLVWHSESRVSARFVPAWGPPAEFRHFDASVFTSAVDRGLVLVLEWRTPNYTLRTGDGLHLAAIADPSLAAAAELGLPFQLHQQMRGTRAAYRLKHPPELCEAWELDEFPQHLVNAYGLRRDDNSLMTFSYQVSNATQRHREQLTVWEYASIIRRLRNDPLFQYAILVPLHDRGVDAFVRILHQETHDLTLLPVQVTDARIAVGGVIDERVKAYENTFRIAETLEEGIVDVIRRAKQTAYPSANTVLLCRILPATSEHVDIYRVRELMEWDEWPFQNIVALHPQSLSTLFCREPYSYLVVQLDDRGRPPRVCIGKTPEDVRQSAKAAKDDIQLRCVM